MSKFPLRIVPFIWFNNVDPSCWTSCRAKSGVDEWSDRSVQKQVQLGININVLVLSKRTNNVKLYKISRSYSCNAEKSVLQEYNIT